MTFRVHTFARRRSRQRGFASIVAISLIGFVAVAMAVIMQSFVADASRTRADAETAQLRQLLTAGELTATAMLHGNQRPADGALVPVALPAELRDVGATLTVQLNVDQQMAVAHIQAKLSKHRSGDSVIRWRHTDAGWALWPSGH